TQAVGGDFRVPDRGVVRGPYPVAVRLCRIGAERFAEISAAYYQIDNLSTVPPWKFTALVYAWAIERVEHGKLDEWITDLNELLEWQDGESAASEAIESESFFTMQAKGG